MGRIVSSLFGLCADSAQAKGTINGGTIEKIAAQGWMSLRKSLARSETMKTKILPPVLFFALLLAACGLSPTSVPATATPTLTPEPTLTFTPAPTATFTPAPTATPELLPADVLATLQGQEYTTVDSDGDENIDKVVAPNGDTLYQLNSENNWQRMITFTNTDNEKIEMPRFETFDEALLYISKHAYWRTGDRISQMDSWTSYDNPRIKEFISINSKFKKIPGWTPYVGLTSPDNSEEFSLLTLIKIGNNTFLRFEPEENWFEIIYVNKSAESFQADNHSIPTPQP